MRGRDKKRGEFRGIDRPRKIKKYVYKIATEGTRTVNNKVIERNTYG